jgi:pimeloyl-ACP methyl ester carboxylesterase
LVRLPFAKVVAAALVAPIVLGCAALPPPPDLPAAEVVVLLHGYGRSERAMRPMARRLEAQGFRVASVRYHSQAGAPGELVDELEAELAACCARAERVHFVAHSLGGLVLRAYLAEHAEPRLGRVVMLGPPNRGSELADLALRLRPIHRIVGPTALALGTDLASFPNTLGPAEFECGVIAGNRSLNPIGSWLIRDDDDGAVAVASTKLDGMADFLVLPASHHALLRSRAVAEQTAHFLTNGRFRSEGAPAPVGAAPPKLADPIGAGG